jgi:ornithine decarboxylase
MDYFRRFTFLFAAPVFDSDDLEGLRFNQIVAEIERSGFEVVRARKLEDAEIAVQTDAAIGCMVVDWGKKGLEGKTSALINLMRRRGLDFPIILLIRRKRFEDLPVEVLDFIDGYVFLSEETPPFIAKNLISRLKQYAETLKTRSSARSSTMPRRAISCGPARDTMAACFTAAAQSAACSWNIWAKRCSATTSTIRCSTSGTS